MHVRRSPAGRPFAAVPRITLDGLPAQARWGYNSFVAPAGRHRVRVAVGHAWELGPAEQELDVLERHTTTLHYAAPAFVFSPGRLGPDPQPHAGLRALWAVWIVIALLLLSGVLGLLLGG